MKTQRKCRTCGAKTPKANPFCSDGFHAPTPDWQNYLTDDENADVRFRRSRIAIDQKQLRLLMKRAKVRKHRANATTP